MLLRKKLSSTQWLALFLLAVGVGVVQIQSGAATGQMSSVHEGMSPLKGIMAVAAACFTSGLAGVYFELQLKGSQVDLWVRNVQLSLFSLLPALAPIIFSHGLTFDGNFSGVYDSLFHNFGAWAWATVSVQCLGGLLTALVIKYADNILKGFATSLSIVISFLASVALFNFQMTFVFVAGSAVVLLATWLYNVQPKRSVAILPTTDWISWVPLNSKEKWRAAPMSMPRIPSSPPVHNSGLESSRSSSSLSLSSVTDEDSQIYTR
jgi:UDP-sugar transporter A1/2/3